MCCAVYGLLCVHVHWCLGVRRGVEQRCMLNVIEKVLLLNPELNGSRQSSQPACPHESRLYLLLTADPSLHLLGLQVPLCPPNFLIRILGIWTWVLMRSAKCFIHWATTPAPKFSMLKSEKESWLWGSMILQFYSLCFPPFRLWIHLHSYSALEVEHSAFLVPLIRRLVGGKMVYV